MRRFQTDVPTNAPIRRKGTIKARRTLLLYNVDVHGSNGSVALAIWEGRVALPLGDTVTIEFDPTIHAWWIVG